MKKKILALCLVIALAATAVIGGTLAYFTDTTEEVTNTFTVGKVDITLDEARVNEMGEKEGDVRVLENTYKLIPGHTYAKDPTVTVAEGSEPCYVRMFVTISKADALSALYDNHWTPADWNVNAGNGWVYYSEGFTVDDVAKTATYEFRCTAVQEPGEMPALFDSFTVDKNLTGDQIATLEDMTITVTAEAIQADGFTNASDAFAALSTAAGAAE